ncbi:hypothetical protein [Aridibaculum aurantiacum]|nr:hypothetical protein [Aridibaculum aurantiacum]
MSLPINLVKKINAMLQGQQLAASLLIALLHQYQKVLEQEIFIDYGIATR